MQKYLEPKIFLGVISIGSSILVEKNRKAKERIILSTLFQNEAAPSSPNSQNGSFFSLECLKRKLPGPPRQCYNLLTKNSNQNNFNLKGIFGDKNSQNAKSVFNNPININTAYNTCTIEVQG